MAEDSKQQEVLKAQSSQLQPTIWPPQRGFPAELLVDKRAGGNFHCEICEMIPRKAMSLVCTVHFEDNEDALLLCCKACLESFLSLSQNKNKCPISDHPNPIIQPNMKERVKISKLMAYCPYRALAKHRFATTLSCTPHIYSHSGTCKPHHSILNPTQCKWTGPLGDIEVNACAHDSLPSAHTPRPLHSAIDIPSKKTHYSPIETSQTMSTRPFQMQILPYRLGMQRRINEGTIVTPSRQSITFS